MKCYQATVLIDDSQVKNRNDLKALIAQLRAAIEGVAGPGSAVFDGLEAHVPEALLAVHEDRLPDQDKVRVELEHDAAINAILLDAVGSTFVTSRDVLAQELGAVKNELARVRAALQKVRASHGIPIYQYERFRGAIAMFLRELAAAEAERDEVRLRPGTDLVPYAAPIAPMMPRYVLLQRCAAGRDGDCIHEQCPQLADGEPHKSGRHCPLDADADAAEDLLHRMNTARARHTKRYGKPPRKIHLGRAEMVVLEREMDSGKTDRIRTAPRIVFGMTVVAHSAASVIITEV